jgi:hypothetical protein
MAYVSLKRLFRHGGNICKIVSGKGSYLEVFVLIFYFDIFLDDFAATVFCQSIIFSFTHCFA